ncbi:21970_t:CDS:2 [Rhizophagus irregularis]|nr:21970_t:CDS:2 [Rhizophagus irregularis]
MLKEKREIINSEGCDTLKIRRDFIFFPDDTEKLEENPTSRKDGVST